MQKKILIFVVAFGIVGILVYSLGSGNPQQDEYEAELKEERLQKDQDFRTAEWSPIPDKTTFKGLNYFPANLKYRVTASIEYISSGETLSMKMSKGNDETYLKYAKATFKIDGESYQLLLLKKTRQEPFVFVAFTDKTSGKETYGAGRYLDIPLKGNPMTLVIDFNRAYNPFCAYNPDFLCPMPPRENHLPVEIPVGEKNYDK